MDAGGHASASKSRPSLEVLTRRQQLAAGVIAGICLLVLAASWSLDRWRFGRSINIEKAYETPNIELKIDINLADWPELTLLPEISETMARRIVAHRERHGDFDRLEQIKQVQGIGPRTLERIEPFLFAISPSASSVEIDGSAQ